MGLMHYFFGEDGKAKLTIDKYVDFKRRLQKEVMQLEVSTGSTGNRYSGCRATWRTRKFQGIGKWVLKVREKSGNFEKRVKVRESQGRV